MTSGRFLAWSKSALQVASGKNYSEVWIISEVNNEVVVETWMAKRCIADYTNTYLHTFAYSVLRPSFKKPLKLKLVLLFEILFYETV